MTPLHEHLAILVDHLLRGDRRACFALADTWRASGIEDADVYTSLLLPALAHIGELWERNTLNIADEHVATEIVRELIARRAAAGPGESPHRGIAVVACVPGEQHDIPGLIFANLLENDGWSVRILGQSVPAEDIVSYVGRHAPALACLIVKTVGRIDDAIRLLDELRATHPATRLIVGGTNDPACRAALQPHVDAFADCPVSGVAVAAQVTAN